MLEICILRKTIFEYLGFFLYFRLNAECTAMDLVHKTLVDEVPYAMCPFQGKVLIGLGKTLRLFDYGKKKLLKKSENRVRSSFV